MTDDNKGAALPVESNTIHAELQAAFARIAEVPAGRTLVDEISSKEWFEGVQGCIEAGSFEHEDDLHDADAEVKKIA